MQLINLEEPLEVDNHNIHIEEHIKFIIADSNNKNNEFVSKLMEHIGKHKQLLKED